MTLERHVPHTVPEHWSLEERGASAGQEGRSQFGDLDQPRQDMISKASVSLSRNDLTSFFILLVHLTNLMFISNHSCDPSNSEG